MPDMPLICDNTYTGHHPTAAGDTCRRCGAKLTTAAATTKLRHDSADTSPVTIERSDAIDAVAGLEALAREKRREAKRRHNAGPHGAYLRAWLRESADVYDAAASRIQRATDAAM